jgi:pimeloyl-ACP methyl ester carboxylesterase
MLAGFGSTVSAWPRDLLETLSEDQEVILVDNRGQGNTIVSAAPTSHSQQALFDAMLR